VRVDSVVFQKMRRCSCVEPLTGILPKIFAILSLPSLIDRDGIGRRRRFCDSMVETVGQSDDRVLRARRRQCLHRKWDMDHSGCPRYDLANRSVAQRTDQRIWPNHARLKWNSIAGNAYIELMLVLPILVAIFLGLATLVSLFLGHVAVTQAAEQGVQALAAGDNAQQVSQIVATTLNQEGYAGDPTTTSAVNGNSHSVTVSVPYTLWNTGGTTTIAASETLTTLSTAGSSGSATSAGGGGGGGSGGIVYHHFPMW
jgi:type II secretory pathway pseudopilin PulG